jgi:hypothetical protein
MNECMYVCMYLLFCFVAAAAVIVVHENLTVLSM